MRSSLKAALAMRYTSSTRWRHFESSEKGEFLFDGNKTPARRTRKTGSLRDSHQAGAAVDEYSTEY